MNLRGEAEGMWKESVVERHVLGSDKHKKRQSR